jgi:hypothetical protein
MELDGIHADDETRGDFLVRRALGHDLGDAALLRCELARGAADVLARRRELAARAFRPRPRTQLVESFDGGPEMRARVAPAVVPSEALAVQELRPRTIVRVHPPCEHLGEDRVVLVGHAIATVYLDRAQNGDDDDDDEGDR